MVKGDQTGKLIVDPATSAIVELSMRMRGAVQEVLVRRYFDKSLPTDSVYCVTVAALRTIGETLAAATNPEDVEDVLRYLRETGVHTVENSLAEARRVHSAMPLPSSHRAGGVDAA